MADASDRGWGPGWPDCQRGKIVPLEVNGTSFPGGVRAEVHDLFVAFLTEFHDTVEWLVEDWCWGFACRAIRGSDRPSNHSWGLAVDVNAPRHPMGESGTFTSAEAQQCRALASKYGLRWGGDYSGRKDEMHFEFMGTPQDARRITEETTMTPEQKKVLEDLTKALASVDSNGWFAAEAVKHLRDHPDGGGSHNHDSRYASKGHGHTVPDHSHGGVE